jgi:predicted nucleic acid-binding protein
MRPAADDPRVREVWSSQGLDRSVLARLRHPAVASTLVPLLTAGQIAVSGILELEVLYSARTHQDFVDTRAELRAYPRLEITDNDFKRAVVVLELLARHGQHRGAGLPDLLEAAVAERNGVTLLHYDAEFDRIASISRQPTEWVVPHASVP